MNTNVTSRLLLPARWCALFTLCSGLAVLGGQLAAELEEAERVASLIRQQGKGAIPAAVDALATGLEHRQARDVVAKTIADASLERAFAKELQERLQREMRSHTKARDAGRMQDVPGKLPDLIAVRRLIEACPVLWAHGRPVTLITGEQAAGLLNTFWDLETAHVLIHATCWADPSPWRREQACVSLIQILARRLTHVPEGNARDWEGLGMSVARALSAAVVSCSARPRFEDTPGWVAEVARQKQVPLGLRLALAAVLREHWPEAAVSVVTQMTLGNRPEAEVAELERLLVESDAVGTRCEAFLLLGAAGKAAEVRARLEAKLRAGGLPEKERANIEFALRLLRGGTP